MTIQRSSWSHQLLHRLKICREKLQIITNFAIAHQNQHLKEEEERENNSDFTESYKKSNPIIHHNSIKNEPKTPKPLASKGNKVDHNNFKYEFTKSVKILGSSGTNSTQLIFGFLWNNNFFEMNINNCINRC